jgi:hypothetical protein
VSRPLLSLVTAVDGDLYITYDEMLCQDHAEAFAESIDVGGDVGVYKNDGD